MSAPDGDDAAREEAAAVDRYLRHRFGVEPVAGAPASATIESGEPDEDEQFAAYMAQHFPGKRISPPNDTLVATGVVRED